MQSSIIENRTDTNYSEASEVKAILFDALERANNWQKKSRERSLAVTKIQEAIFWLQHDIINEPV